MESTICPICNDEIQSVQFLFHRTLCGSACSIRSSPHHGKGVFATRNLDANELLFTEEPVLVAGALDMNAATFYALEDSVLEALLDLHDSEEQEGKPKSLVGISRTNGVSTGNTRGEGCICLAFSRINHSCRPNCHYEYEGGHMRVTSLTRIPKGEELVISYKDELMFSSRIMRRLCLFSLFSFECACDACEGLLYSPESDARRTRIGELLRLIENAVEREDHRECKKMCEERLQLLQEEGWPNGVDYANTHLACFECLHKAGLKEEAKLELRRCIDWSASRGPRAVAELQEILEQIT